MSSTMFSGTATDRYWWSGPSSIRASDTSGFLEAAGFDACDHMTAVRKECT